MIVKVLIIPKLSKHIMDILIQAWKWIEVDVITVARKWFNATVCGVMSIRITSWGSWISEIMNKRCYLMQCMIGSVKKNGRTGIEATTTGKAFFLAKRLAWMLTGQQLYQYWTVFFKIEFVGCKICFHASFDWLLSRVWFTDRLSRLIWLVACPNSFEQFVPRWIKQNTCLDKLELLIIATFWDPLKNNMIHLKGFIPREIKNCDLPLFFWVIIWNIGA